MAKNKSKKNHVVRNIVIVVVLVLVVVSVVMCTRDEPEEMYDMDWPTDGIAALLPVPEWAEVDEDSGDATVTGDLIIDSSDYFECYVAVDSESDYSSYVEACKDAGFTVDYDNDGDSYYALNEDGYELVLEYYDEDDSDYEYASMSIELTAPMTMEEITWPTSGLATNLPVPEWAEVDASSGEAALTGEITADNTSYFRCYLAVDSIDDYTAYIEDCEEAGFTVDAESGDTTYSAQNAEGYQLDLRYSDEDSSSYYGTASLYVSLAAPDDEEEEAEEAETEEAEETEDEASTETSEEATEETEAETETEAEAETETETETETEAESTSDTDSTEADVEVGVDAVELEDEEEIAEEAEGGAFSELLSLLSYSGFQEIYEEYAQEIEETTPTLVEEFNTEAASLGSDINALAELCNEKIQVLAEIEVEGTEVMAAYMYAHSYSDSAYEEYEEYASMLYSVYEEQASLITDAYLDASTGALLG